jgi:catechol 2,3-dioxygenase-like lactoylglutathione lyase family enzyme
MASKFTQVVIDCREPEKIAEFWREVLGYHEIDRSQDGAWVELEAGPASPGPILFFLKVPEGKTVKNRLHIDVSPTDRDRDAEVERLLALGARKIDVGQGDASWVVMADPEDNEFCVLNTRPEA